MIRFLRLIGYILLIGVLASTQGPAQADSASKKSRQARTNTIGIAFVFIPAGSFVMGEARRSECNTCNAAYDEVPRHKVWISKPFYISRYEVTQQQWLEIMDVNPSRFKGNDRPVENVSWNNVRLFIYALNSREKTKAYRLPTEAEWEYAARAGTVTAYSFGDDPGKLPAYGWFVENAGLKTHPVGKRLPNPWGLYDMHGNVYEWCRDVYQPDYYRQSRFKNPTGPGLDTGERVRRGGYWGSSARSLRSPDRDAFAQDQRAGTTGFRLVMEAGG